MTRELFDGRKYKRLYPTATKLAVRRARYDHLREHGMTVCEMWDEAGKQHDLWDKEHARWMEMTEQ